MVITSRPPVLSLGSQNVPFSEPFPGHTSIDKHFAFHSIAEGTEGHPTKIISPLLKYCIDPVINRFVTRKIAGEIGSPTNADGKLSVFEKRATT